MMDENGSTIPRRRLGRQLRELRERTHLSQDDAATALDCSRQKIWRIERGAVPVRPRDVKVLCNLYNAGPGITQALVRLALRTREKGWWQAYDDVLPAWFSRYVGLESAASRLRCYQSGLVPALLQTRPYIEAVCADWPGVSDSGRARLVDVQLRRQEMLSCATGPRLDVFLSEAVLHRRVLDPPQMVTQLCHLWQSSMRQNISVRVVPLDAGPILAASAGSFVLLDFPANDDALASEVATVYLESLAGATCLDRPDEIILYEQAWSELARHAFDEVDSGKLIRTLAQRG